MKVKKAITTFTTSARNAIYNNSKHVLAFTFGLFNGSIYSLKEFLIMAFKKNETKANTNETNVNDNARVTIVGKVVDVIEGKKYNYLKIHASRTKINPKTNTPYYDEFSVKFDKSIALPKDECHAIIAATLSSFYDKDRQCTIIVIEGESIDTNVSNN